MNTMSIMICFDVDYISFHEPSKNFKNILMDFI